MPVSFHQHPPSSPYKAYLEESQWYFSSLLFSLPLFLAYHIGVWTIKEFSDSGLENGADVLIRRGLAVLGVGGPLVSLFLVVAVMLFLQQASGKPWRLRGSTVILMSLECMVFALPPFLLGKLVREVLEMQVTTGTAPSVFQAMILSLGAGVYEEFLFRMILMGFLFFVFRGAFRMRGMRLYITVMLVQAVLFALFHHIPGSKENLEWSFPFLRAFAFRTIAGVYFAYLYQERGFGIAAGSHALYDVIAVGLNAFR